MYTVQHLRSDNNAWHDLVSKDTLDEALTEFRFYAYPVERRNATAYRIVHAGKTIKRTAKHARISLAYLKARVSETSPYFFTRKTMRFFGDTMRNYRIAGVKQVTTPSGDIHSVWILERKRAVKHNLDSDTYFDRETFTRVHSA